MITIKNISSSLVSLYAPAVHFNRELTPGREIPLSEDEYNELIFDSGFMSLVNSHYIKINGVEEEQQVEIVENVFDKDTIEKMLVNNDVTAFAKFIPTATDAEKDSVVTLAVKHKVTGAGIVALIKKYCDVDIINAINVAHQSEEK